MVNTHTEPTSPTHTNKTHIVWLIKKKKTCYESTEADKREIYKVCIFDIDNVIYLFLKSRQFMIQICYDSVCYLQLLL